MHRLLFRNLGRTVKRAPLSAHQKAWKSSSAAEKRAMRARSKKGGDGGKAPEPLSKKEASSNTFWFGMTAMCGALAFCVYDFFNNPKTSFLLGTPLEKPLQALLEATRSMEEPYSDKLIPDYPNDPYYAQDDSPPGTPPRILLVLDVEKTIFGTEYDARYGFRYFKRPGLEQFLKQMAVYFEVVLHYESDASMEPVQALLEQIQPYNAFVLGPGHVQKEIDGTLVKRLDLMNRDIHRIILIDDDKDSAKMFPRNTLFVKPYDTYNDDDTTLLDLIPVLQSVVHHQKKDVRDFFDDLAINHDADDVATEYRRRVWMKKQQYEDKRNKGLGKFLRANLPSKDNSDSDNKPIKPVHIEEDEEINNTTGALSTYVKELEKKNMPSVPATEIKIPKGKAKKGGFFQWLAVLEQEKMENEQRRQERMQQIMMKKQAEALKAQQDEKL